MKRLERNEKNNLEQDVMLSVPGMFCSNMPTARNSDLPATGAISHA